MTARCGSNDPTHRANSCPDCNRIYHQRSRSGAPRFKIRAYADAATCAFCGITAGNSADVPVYRYPLKRWARKRQAWIGSIGLCDTCIVGVADLKPQFRPVAA